MSEIIIVGHLDITDAFLHSGIIIGIAWGIEALIPLLLVNYVTHRDLSDAYSFWRSLCRCFSFHLPLTVLMIGITIAAAGPFELAVDLVPYVIAVFLINLMLWWINLMRATWVRTVPSKGNYIVLILGPAVGLCALALVGFGFWVAVLFVTHA